MDTNKKFTLLFDFDGTIADTFNPFIHIYNSKIAPQFNTKPISDKDRECLRSMRPQDMMKEYNITVVKLARIVLKARKELSLIMKTIKPHNGIINTLKKLYDKNYSLNILTSNSKSNVLEFLRSNKLDNFIETVYTGRHIFGKHRIINRIINKKGLDKSKVIMIGDETRDLEAGKKADIPTIGVTWGYSSETGLKSVNFGTIVNSVNNLFEAIEKISKKT